MQLLFLQQNVEVSSSLFRDPKYRLEPYFSSNSCETNINIEDKSRTAIETIASSRMRLQIRSVYLVNTESGRRPPLGSRPDDPFTNGAAILVRARGTASRYTTEQKISKNAEESKL